jgi:hypothetical protein
MSPGKDIRRHRRIPYLGPIRISWEEQGQPRFAMARCIDISEAGLRIESPAPIRAGASIQLGAERIKLTGSATVKNVVRNGSKYLVGLQLTRAMLGSTIEELDGGPMVTALIENLNRTY